MTYHFLKNKETKTNATVILLFLLTSYFFIINKNVTNVFKTKNQTNATVILLFIPTKNVTNVLKTTGRWEGYCGSYGRVW
jgi:hypothetical protein